MENPREILNKVQLGVMTDGIVRDLNNNDLESFEKWLENQPEFMKDWYKDHKEIAHDDYNNMYVLAYGVPVEKKVPDRNDHTLYEELQRSGEVYILDDEQGNTVSITEEELNQFINDTYSNDKMMEIIDEYGLDNEELLDSFVDYILEANDEVIEQDLNDYFGYKFNQENNVVKADEEPKANYEVTEEQLEDFIEYLISEDKANKLAETLDAEENIHDALAEKICNTSEYDEALAKFICENYEEDDDDEDQDDEEFNDEDLDDDDLDDKDDDEDESEEKDLDEPDSEVDESLPADSKAASEIKDILNSTLDTEEVYKSLSESIEEYKGFQIEYDLYKQNEYTVQYNGDDIVFNSIDEAKQFIDEIIANSESKEVEESLPEAEEAIPAEEPVKESTNCEVSYSFGKYTLTEEQLHEYIDNNISEADQEYAVLKVNPEFDVDSQVVAEAFYPWLKENWRVFKSDAAAYFKERFEEEYYGNLLKEDVRDSSALALGKVVDVTKLVEEETKSSGTFREILNQVKQATENYSLEEGTLELSDDDADSFAVNMVTKFLKNHYETVEVEVVESAYRVKFKDPKLPEEEPIEMPEDAPVEAEPELDIETFKGYDGNFDESAPYWNY